MLGPQGEEYLRELFGPYLSEEELTRLISEMSDQDFWQGILDLVEIMIEGERRVKRLAGDSSPVYWR